MLINSLCPSTCYDIVSPNRIAPTWSCQAGQNHETPSMDFVRIYIREYDLNQSPVS